MSHKVLALIEYDDDGALHITAAEQPVSIDAFARVVQTALPRREITWFPRLCEFKVGLTREVTRHPQSTLSVVDVRPVGIHSPNLADAIAWLAGCGERPR